MTERVRIRKVKGRGRYKGQFAAYYGRQFFAFAYAKSIGELMDKLYHGTYAKAIRSRRYHDKQRQR